MAGARRLLSAIRAEGAGAFVADTSPVVYYVDNTGVPELVRACDYLFLAVVDGELECVVSSITVAELLVAPLRGSPGEVIAVDSFLRQPRLHVAAADERIARAGAELVAGGLVARLSDALIVATALDYGLPLVTGDRRLARAGVVPTHLLADYA